MDEPLALDVRAADTWGMLVSDFKLGPRPMRWWPLALLLVGSLGLWASLYLPWQDLSCSPTCSGPFGNGNGDLASTLGLPSLSFAGWSAGSADSAALSALFVAAVAVVGLARPRLEARLPFGLAAMLAAYFGIAVATESWSMGDQQEVFFEGSHYNSAYGMYLGLAALVTMLIGGLARGRRPALRAIPMSTCVVALLTAGLLCALLLPWGRLPAPGPDLSGLSSSAGSLTAILALSLLALWGSGSHTYLLARLVMGLAVGLFAAATVSSRTFPVSHAPAAWVGLGISAVMAAFVTVYAIRAPRPRLPSWFGLGVVGAMSILAVSLFLPTGRYCYAKDSQLGVFSGRCVSSSGWASTEGAVAAGLAVALVVVVVSTRWSAISLVVLAAGICTLVATLCVGLIEVDSDPEVRYLRGYGWIPAAIGAVLLLALTAARLRPGTIRWQRALVRLLPMAACAIYLALVVVPWWRVLPDGVQLALRSSRLSWLTIVAALIAGWLLSVWIRQIARPSRSSEWLLLLPLLLLALTVTNLLAAVVNSPYNLDWGHGITLALGLLLTFLGRLEARDGLEAFRIPEALRFDRL